MTDAQVIETFNAAEKAAGGPHFADAKAIIEQIAADNGVDVERVRNVMIDHWFCTVSG